MSTVEKNIAVLYHAKCIDGFGVAFAAYKKFGDTAEYIPVSRQEPAPDNLEGKEVYIADFSYSADELRDIEKRAKSLTVLDHHISAKEDVESVKNHIFDNEHSGAVLMWNYLHPSIEAPKLLQYVEDNDLWRFALPNSNEVQQVIGLTPFEFEKWDALARQLEDEKEFKKIVEKGTILKEQWAEIVNQLAVGAREVDFEGYIILAVNASSPFRSKLGHFLAQKKPPFAIVWYYDNAGTLSFSLRGDGSIDVSKIAQKYGGGGHHNAASFKITKDLGLPFKEV
jgi:oligoribonuclease NrnB/cAMP/cGMP phosphodiesterase (DHH superfamily)